MLCVEAKSKVEHLDVWMLTDDPSPLFQAVATAFLLLAAPTPAFALRSCCCCFVPLSSMLHHWCSTSKFVVVFCAERATYVTRVETSNEAALLRLGLLLYWGHLELMCLS